MCFPGVGFLQFGGFLVAEFRVRRSMCGGSVGTYLILFAEDWRV